MQVIRLTRYAAHRTLVRDSGDAPESISWAWDTKLRDSRYLYVTYRQSLHIWDTHTCVRMFII